MSSRNRERKAANREKRAAHEEAMRRRARRQRWILGVGGLVLAGVIAFVVINNLTDDDNDQVVADDTSSTTSAASTDTTVATTETTAGAAETTVPAAESAAGKPCVAVSEPLPEGAPDVPVQVGPPPTELVIDDLKVGDGDEVTAGSTVSVNYIGVSCSTGVIFDDSYSRGQPAEFPLDQVIPGWTQGLEGMKVGGRRLLGIPPAMAYGAEGRPPDIAPDETLWFVVDMLETTPAG